ncbi:hypothetical protein AM493_17725 [Flavobacterium akiainvivens]|uniref:VanZ-like domain-containing protein n=1 Tax=Flavobacterium akiainvivens TaxID=1202724 RepID=A0A0M8MKG2_9FLAO|nr:VanZ family protein [Flavobacterium akiainvivens]KOS07677.1 hypothetical protein AM493_17725 [Flavobacterium akiainvivens]SFQ24052.1 VanZ like family protein [Flavobacterium akiainvivens]
MHNKYFWAAIFWTVVISICCLVSIKTFEGAADIGSADKYVHFTFYFIFTILWCFFLKSKNGNSFKIRLIVFAFAFSFGAIIEACQEFLTEDRSADIGDVIANTSGSAGAVLFMWLKDKLSKKK